jgi:heme/copper-type cytochrome/quinol oxidase subunit 4
MLDPLRAMSALPPKADIAQSPLARDRGGTINGYAIPVARAVVLIIVVIIIVAPISSSSDASIVTIVGFCLINRHHDA